MRHHGRQLDRILDTYQRQQQNLVDELISRLEKAKAHAREMERQLACLRVKYEKLKKKDTDEVTHGHGPVHQH